MDSDDLDAVVNINRGKTLGCDLSLMGVDELKAYVSDLQGETDRVHSEIIKKEAVRSHAEEFFKST